MDNFKNGDIILTSRDSLIVRFMRWFQSDPVIYGHALVIDVDNNCALEAGWTIRATPLEKVFKVKNHKSYKIIRYTELTESQAQVMLKVMYGLTGKLYSLKRIFLQVLDHLFFTNWFTKLDKSKTSQVCSSYVAWGYYIACKIQFNGVDWASCDPDDIDDETLKNPYLWEIIEVR